MALTQKLDKLLVTKVLHNSVDQIKDHVEKKTEDREKIKLSKELKEGTKKLHREAERIRFVREFLRGKIERTVYMRQISDFYYLYSALEEEYEKHASHPLFRVIHFPKEFNRVETLKADLLYYYGQDWEDEIEEPSDATKEYIDRIHQAADEDPALLISHHYSRYLGFLLGGPTLEKRAIKMFELPTSGEGIKFYRYDNISNTNEFTAMYKSRLDSLEPSREQADKLVEEANVSFLLSIKMLKELDELSGFMEEVVHEQVELVDEREDDEPLASQKDEEKAHRKGNKKESTHEENVNGQQTPSKTNKQEPIGCFRIMAVAALVLAIMLGFTIRMVGQF